MSALSNKPGQQSRAAMPAFGAFSASSASMLLEKANPGLRRSTPDSEALASSDDEIDHHRSAQPISSTGVQRPMRRTSWLNEIPSSTRKPSMTATTPYSPTNSHPATPSGDQSTWGAGGSPGLGAGAWSSTPGTSYPWGSIWNSDGRKELPSRLQEVLPSPTAINQIVPGFLSDDYQSATLSRNLASETAIPFSIPLHPTPKTYRSQSYSVGQLDPETFGLTSPQAPGVTNANRGRGGGQYPGLVRRTSRPSGLGDRGHDGGTLGRVHEVDDDDDDDEAAQDLAHKEQQARKIEQLTRENELLKKAQHEQRLRDRTASSISAANGHGTMASPLEKTRARGGVTDDSALAVDEYDDPQNDFTTRDSLGRRYSKSSNTDMERQPVTPIENRNIENIKKAHWQTSLGFETALEPPQSRRHSFADVPTRHGSISSATETYPGSAALDPHDSRQNREDGYGAYTEDSQDKSRGEYRKSSPVSFQLLEEQKLELEHLHNRHFAAQYFAGSELGRRAGEETHRSLGQAYVNPNAYGRELAFNTNAGHHIQPLYIVSFKCRRSDVFYIQEATGLHVNLGDLVIVEADRGTDLGTVMHANLTWDEARQKKEEYAEEHYKWLMMFSRQSQTGGPNAVNPNGLSGLNGAPGSAVGGMGPPGHHAPQEPQSGELKPKLIKRLAQNHEVQTLKDKEGNEAKAKRMCQQKVVEHRLNMEILDAEFQMDWKKLTFYYFADSYINFNSLVTDLFKIYKTRIWMSAINPASFVTPTSSLSIPHSFGMHGLAGDSPSGRRRQHGLNMSQPSPVSYDESTNTPQSYLSSQGNGLRNAYFNPYQSPGGSIQQPESGVSAYPPMMQQSTERFTPYLNSPYHMLNPTASSFATSHGTPGRTTRTNQSSAPDWTTNFQGLSLGS